MNDGSNEVPPYVLKSSRRKVEQLKNLDKDMEHRLSTETVFLDVLHSRCKSWKTDTLSYYDGILRELVKLVTMEAEIENGENCELFFRVINQILQTFICEKEEIRSSSYIFNPIHIKCDEHSGNRIGITAVFGDEFLENRTSSCEYHYDKSVEKHKKYVRNEDVGLYKTLSSSIKNSVTTDHYNNAKH